MGEVYLARDTKFVSQLDALRLTSYSPSRNAETLFIVRALEGSSPSRLMLIQNWAAEFETQ